MAAADLHRPGPGIPRDALRRLAWLALWSAGIAGGAYLIALTLRDDALAGSHVSAVMGILVGWSLMASGLIAWRRRPRHRLGPFMVLLGGSWLAGLLLATTDWPPAFTAGLWAGDAWVVPLVFFLVTFPSGRLASRADRLLVAPFVLATIVIEPVWLLFWDPGPPGSVLLAWPDPGVADAIDTVQRVILVAASFALTAALAARWRRASPPLRRGLTPILAGAVTILASTGSVVVSKITHHPPPELLQIAVFGCLIGVPLALLADMLRARFARSAIAELVLALRDHPAPADLRTELARALGDPSLAVAFWLPESETYADLDGRPVALLADERRVTTMVDRSGRPVAALVHDPSLRDEPALLDAVGAAAGIALENARLLADLRSTGARVLAAAHGERRRLERDLHDGAQQRLVALALELGMLEARLGGDPDARRSLVRARGEVERSLEELRELARGIHPAVLSGHGLEAALEGLVARAPVPVRLTVNLHDRLPEPIEVAAYFLVSESLTNVAKYAHASAASVAVSRVDGQLVVEVADDGVGGAGPDGGSGLRGLADRVDALGGRLHVMSPVGDGTCVRAEIPCA